MDWNNNNVNYYFDIQCNSFLGLHYFQKNQVKLEQLLNQRDSQRITNTDDFDLDSNSNNNSSSSEIIISLLLKIISQLKCLLATCDMKDSYNPPTVMTIPLPFNNNNGSIHLSKEDIRNGVNRRATKFLLKKYNDMLDIELIRQQKQFVTNMKETVSNSIRSGHRIASLDNFSEFDFSEVSDAIKEMSDQYPDRPTPQPVLQINTTTPSSTAQPVLATTPASTGAGTSATISTSYQLPRSNTPPSMNNIINDDSRQFKPQNNNNINNSYTPIDLDAPYNNNNNRNIQQNFNKPMNDDNNSYYNNTRQQQPPPPKPTIFKPPVLKSNKTLNLEDDDDEPIQENAFKSAKDQFITDQEKKNRQQSSYNQRPVNSYLNQQSNQQSSSSSAGSAGTVKTNAGKVLGGKRKGFVSPYKQPDEDEVVDEPPKKATKPKQNNSGGGNNNGKNDESNPSGIDNVNGVPLDDERLRNVEPRMLELICNEILDKKLSVNWDDIAGLEGVKKQIKELATYPLLRPDIFKGLRNPPKGLLLFGPPGTGKTMIGRALASGVNATFFSISASSLTSKWIGDGEKMVRALFAVARCYLPSVIFIDEIDSLLTQRTDGENEASRRIKTEFLVQWDGVATNSADRMLLVGATNRPEELDEAARRRLVKRLYIPLPEKIARYQLVKHLLSSEVTDMTEDDYQVVAELTEGYSGSDMKALCTEAAMIPIRGEIDILNATTNEIRPIALRDFQSALSSMKPSVAQSELKNYLEWNKQFGGLTS